MSFGSTFAPKKAPQPAAAASPVDASESLARARMTLQDQKRASAGITAALAKAKEEHARAPNFQKKAIESRIGALLESQKKTNQNIQALETRIFRATDVQAQAEIQAVHGGLNAIMSSANIDGIIESANETRAADQQYADMTRAVEYGTSDYLEESADAVADFLNSSDASTASQHAGASATASASAPRQSAQAPAAASAAPQPAVDIAARRAAMIQMYGRRG
jgi:hypothetical protein